MHLSDPSSSAEAAGTHTSKLAQGHLHYHLCLETGMFMSCPWICSPPTMYGKDFRSWAVCDMFGMPHQDQQCLLSLWASQALH